MKNILVSLGAWILAGVIAAIVYYLLYLFFALFIGIPCEYAIMLAKCVASYWFLSWTFTLIATAIEEAYEL